MFKRNLIAAAVALAFAGPALAQDADLGKIREEIRQMKDAYEKRIQAWRSGFPKPKPKRVKRKPPRRRRKPPR